MSSSNPKQDIINIIWYVKFHQDPPFLSQNIKQKPFMIDNYSRGGNSVVYQWNMPSNNPKQDIVNIISYMQFHPILSFFLSIK